MRIGLILAGVAAAGLMAFPAMAQDGQYGPQLGQILAQGAEGACDEALMGPPLLSACSAQIAGMGPALQALGTIESMTFVSAQDTPDGRVETWSVKYAGGRTLTWIIGHQQPDGKFNTVGTAA